MSARALMADTIAIDLNSYPRVRGAGSGRSANSARAVERHAVQRCDVDAGSWVGGVHHLSATDVEADVAQLVEEDEVSGLEVRFGDWPAGVPLRVGHRRDVDPRSVPR